MTSEIILKMPNRVHYGPEMQPLLRSPQRPKKRGDASDGVTVRIRSLVGKSAGFLCKMSFIAFSEAISLLISKFRRPKLQSSSIFFLLEAATADSA